MSKKDEQIYNSLTNVDDVLSGLYAYSYYIEEKNTWIKIFENSNNRKPTEKELEVFYRKKSVKGYLEKGKEFANMALLRKYEAKIEEERRACYDNINSQVTKALNDQPAPSKWRGFGVNAFASFVGSVAIAIATALIVFVTILSDNEFRNLFYKKVGVWISPPSESVGNSSSSSTNSEEEKNGTTVPFEASRPPTISNKEPSY